MKVRARRWFTTKEAYTDAEGKFVIWHDFDRPKNYSIVWERDDFDIRDGSFGQAIYNGPQTSGYWNLDISSGASRMYAIVHQAAYNYYYGNRLGLKSPPKNSFWASAVKISVHEESNSDDKLGVHCKDCRFLGIASRLKIWDSSRTTDQLYATTIHELAHASHWELRQNNWNDNNTDDIVKESWARGIQRELTRLRYPNYEPPYFGIYTGIVRDLIDGRDGYDQVEGYTILQVENVLKNTSSFEDLENNIRNNYNNPTENGLTAVFDFWN